jgi:hypothetical protein
MNNLLIKRVLQAIHNKEISGSFPREVIRRYFQTHKNDDNPGFYYGNIDHVTIEDIEQVKQALKGE